MNETADLTESHETFRVRVTFPELFAQGTHKFEKDPGHFEPLNSIFFTEMGHMIRIIIFPDKIRRTLATNPIVYRIIMETIAAPAIKKVRDDLRNVDDLLKEIRSKLVVNGIHGMFFNYEKNSGNYKVFEGHIKRDPATGDFYHLFEKVLIVKCMPKESVYPAYRELYNLIQSLNVCRDAETGEAYIASNSLRTAVEDAILLYTSDDAINSFPVEGE